MAISHAGHNHPSTPSARAKCRRGQQTQGATQTATPRALKVPDEEFHPADKDRCCYNCRLRLIEWKGMTRISRMMIYVCEKCYYMLDKDEPIEPMEV